MRIAIIISLVLFFTAAAPITTMAQESSFQIGGGEGYNGNIPYSDSYKRHKVNLFIDHEDAPLTVTIGYVNKYWRTDFKDYVYKENLWGEENKRMHGIQIGATFQPCTIYGLGLHSGLFYEAYFSESNAVKEYGHDNFTEHNLYLPLHLMLRLPLGREASLQFFAGLGMNWAFLGEYRDKEDRWYEYYEDEDGDIHVEEHWPVSEYQQYGSGSWPRRMNFSTEFGANLRIHHIQVGLTFSRGMTDHTFYSGHRTSQNKFGLNVSYAF